MKQGKGLQTVNGIKHPGTILPLPSYRYVPISPPGTCGSLIPQTSQPRKPLTRRTRHLTLRFQSWGLSAGMDPEQWYSWKRHLHLLSLSSNFLLEYCNLQHQDQVGFQACPLVYLCVCPTLDYPGQMKQIIWTSGFPSPVRGSFWLRTRQETEQSFLRLPICYQAAVTFPRDFNNRNCLAGSSFPPADQFPPDKSMGRRRR